MGKPLLNVIFRRATERDLFGITQIIVEGFRSKEEQQKYLKYCEEGPYVAPGVVSDFENPRDRVMIVALNERQQVIGELILDMERYGDKKIANINSVAVRKGYRGHGIARDLIKMAEEIAYKEHFDIIQLQVSAANEVAIFLYESMQYHRNEFTNNLYRGPWMAESYRGYGANGWEMQKRIRPQQGRSGCV